MIHVSFRSAVREGNSGNPVALISKVAEVIALKRAFCRDPSVHWELEDNIRDDGSDHGGDHGNDDGEHGNDDGSSDGGSEPSEDEEGENSDDH